MKIITLSHPNHERKVFDEMQRKSKLTQKTFSFAFSKGVIIKCCHYIFIAPKDPLCDPRK